LRFFVEVANIATLQFSVGRNRGKSVLLSSKHARWLLGILVVVIIVDVPLLHHRYRYQHSKRLREVSPGKVYRSGAMLADGFRETFERYKIRTVINLQNEAPDPEVRLGFFTSASIRESELCRQHNVRFVFLSPDLVSRRLVPEARPKVIDDFLALLDDPANYPVLIHCRAGLHRTGVLSAVYRMEYEGWPIARAMAELKANGFGDRQATCANDYIKQYVLTYKPGQRKMAVAQQ